MFLKQTNTISDTEIQSFPAIQKINSFIQMVLKKWWLFAIVAVLGGICGIVYASFQKTLYKSHLTFALDDANNNMGGLMNLASQFGISMGGGKDIFEGDNITEIMKSRRMIQKVLLSKDTFDNKPYTLIEYYLQKIRENNNKTVKNQVHFPVNQSDSSFSYQQDSVLYCTYLEISKKIVAERPDRKLSIYEVSVTTPDEKFTKDFTDRLVNATNNFYVEIRTKKAKETLDILEQRVASMRGNLNSSITSKATVQDANINPTFSEAQVPVQKQQANIQVYGAAYSEMFKNLEMARFQYLNEIPLMQIIDAANYPMEKIKASRLKTAVTGAFISCFILLFIFWIIRISNYDKN